MRPGDKNPWENWATGEWVELAEGVDFDSNLRAIRSGASR